LSNPQSWNRYSYVQNRPISFNDPTGHSICGLGGTGGCDREEELVSYAAETVKRLGKKNDLLAMTRIIEKASKLYRTNEEMIPALSYVFLGIRESNPATLLHALHANPCVAIGREIRDCPANAQRGVFGDTGFNKDFRDTFSQPFHFWAYVATSANTEGATGPGSYLPGRIVSNVGNTYHEIIQPDGAGATWQDYALARAGMNIGTLINLGVVGPDQLAGTINDYLGEGGPGAYYVDPLVMIAPLQGNR
jgi:hypothetical protein